MTQGGGGVVTQRWSKSPFMKGLQDQHFSNFNGGDILVQRV